MFTVEIKINGAMIGHIYGRNVGEIDDMTVYEYEYYRPENRKLITGEIMHKKRDGIEKLIEIILNNYGKKKDLP